MGFFDKLVDGLGGPADAAKNFGSANDISQGILGVTGALIGRGAAKADAAVVRQTAEINAKRVRRSMRYQQGLAAVGAAADGGGQLGSVLFTMADNARAAEENVQSELLRAKQVNIARKAALPSGVEIAAGFVSNLALGIANRKVSEYKADD